MDHSAVLRVRRERLALWFGGGLPYGMRARGLRDTWQAGEVVQTTASCAVAAMVRTVRGRFNVRRSGLPAGHYVGLGTRTSADRMYMAIQRFMSRIAHVDG